MSMGHAQRRRCCPLIRVLPGSMCTRGGAAQGAKLSHLGMGYAASTQPSRLPLWNLHIESINSIFYNTVPHPKNSVHRIVCIICGASAGVACATSVPPPYWLSAPTLAGPALAPLYEAHPCQIDSTPTNSPCSFSHCTQPTGISGLIQIRCDTLLSPCYGNTCTGAWPVG